MDTIGLWQIGEAGPVRLEAAQLAAEKELENWIERDPALLEQGLLIVGRQLRLEGGPLDLLALDPQGRWVVIELKPDCLRRNAIAQAIDYASCLVRVPADWLRERCDAYLQKKGAQTTLDALLDERGRSLEGQADGREVLIYLVGTGYDAGLERMVEFLAERAELAIRVVTFSVFRDAQGRLVLSRQIHESTAPAVSALQRATKSSPSPETVLALGDQNGVGSVMRTLYSAAMELGFPAQTYTGSIRFAPPANRTRCLFVVWAQAMKKAPGVAKAWISNEGFEQFYGIKKTDLAAAVGPVGQYVTLDQAGAEHVAAGLRHLLAVRDQE